MTEQEKKPKKTKDADVPPVEVIVQSMRWDDGKSGDASYTDTAHTFTRIRDAKKWVRENAANGFRYRVVTVNGKWSANVEKVEQRTLQEI